MSTATAITVHVNDEPHSLAGEPTLHALLAHLQLADRKGIAAAVNGAVVPRTAWPTHALAAADRVLVIRATQGG